MNNELEDSQEIRTGNEKCVVKLEEVFLIVYCLHQVQSTSIGTLVRPESQWDFGTVL